MAETQPGTKTFGILLQIIMKDVAAIAKKSLIHDLEFIKVLSITGEEKW